MRAGRLVPELARDWARPILGAGQTIHPFGPARRLEPGSQPPVAADLGATTDRIALVTVEGRLRHGRLFARSAASMRLRRVAGNLVITQTSGQEPPRTRWFVDRGPGRPQTCALMGVACCHPGSERGRHEGLGRSMLRPNRHELATGSTCKFRQACNDGLSTTVAGAGVKCIAWYPRSQLSLPSSHRNV